MRLGVNIDHIATIRNARGGVHPDPVRAARLACASGADGITVHLREDRRHIFDNDIYRLMKEVDLPLNLEMAATGEMLGIAIATKPNAVCLVPEKREEITTEGGLNLNLDGEHLPIFVEELKRANIKVSAFVDPDLMQIDGAHSLGFDVVELHTGSYCNSTTGEGREIELMRLMTAAKSATSLGLECHAGHGLSFTTVSDVAAITEISELNIGHFIVGEAVFIGLKGSILKMRALIDEARNR